MKLYDALVPVAIRALNNCAAVLEKGAAHCEAKKIDPAVLTSARLYPDMFPLLRQVQIASDTAKFGVTRLLGVEAPAYDDTETTFPELVARLRKTVAYLETFKSEQFEGCEGRTVNWKTRNSTRSMQGLAYLQEHVLPNVFFHTTAVYAILRHNGVEIGKKDFLGI